jgi:hypothetical protein
MFNNYVTADGKIYRQMEGTATGTPVAPPFANLYLFYKYQEILGHPGINIQSRFIDDGCLLVKDARTAVDIAKRMNDECNLEFTFNISKTEAIYLDIHLFKGPRWESTTHLDMKPYFKPTNKLLYLPSVSQHPGAHKASVIKGEAIRCLRNSISKLEWLKAMDTIFKGLKARGYRPALLAQKFKTVRFQDRTRYIHAETVRKKPERRILLTQYNATTRFHWKRMLIAHPIHNVLIQYRLGRYSVKQKQILTDWPGQVVFKDFAVLCKRVISASDYWQQDNTRTETKERI